VKEMLVLMMELARTVCFMNECDKYKLSEYARYSM